MGRSRNHVPSDKIGSDPPRYRSPRPRSPRPYRRRPAGVPPMPGHRGVPRVRPCHRTSRRPVRRLGWHHSARTHSHCAAAATLKGERINPFRLSRSERPAGPGEVLFNEWSCSMTDCERCGNPGDSRQFVDGANRTVCAGCLPIMREQDAYVASRFAPSDIEKMHRQTARIRESAGLI